MPRVQGDNVTKTRPTTPIDEKDEKAWFEFLQARPGSKKIVKKKEKK